MLKPHKLSSQKEKILFLSDTHEFHEPSWNPKPYQSRGFASNQEFSNWFRAKWHEDFRKSFEVFSPINHRAGHGRTFSGVRTVFQEPQTCVVQKANCGCFTVNVHLPMPRIGGNRDQRNHFSGMNAMSFLASPQPVLNRPAMLLVDTIWRIYVNSREAPRLPKPIVLGQQVLHFGLHD